MKRQVLTHLKGEFDKIQYFEGTMLPVEGEFYLVHPILLQKGWQFFETILRHPSNEQALLGAWKSMKDGGKPAIVDFNPDTGEIVVLEAFIGTISTRTYVTYDERAQKLFQEKNPKQICNGNAVDEVAKMNMTLPTPEVALRHLLPHTDRNHHSFEYLLATDAQRQKSMSLPEGTAPQLGHTNGWIESRQIRATGCDELIGFRGIMRIKVPPTQSQAT